jgi:tetratricopeptide (TPR) repeat protein
VQALLPETQESDEKANLYGLLGSSLDQQGKTVEAIDALTKAILLSPESRHLYHTRGVIYARKGDWDEAIRDFDEAIRIDSTDEMSYWCRGKAWAQKGRQDRALVDYANVLRINPDNIDVRMARANIWYARGESDRAVAELKVLDGKLLTKGEDLRARAWSAHERGQFEKAVADWTAAMKIDPKDSRNYYDRGRSFARMERPREALADFDEFIRLKPDAASGYAARVLILTRANENEIRDGRRAVTDAQRACELTKWREPYYLVLLGSAHAEAGNKEDAIRWVTKAVEIVPEGEREEYRATLELFKAGKTIRDMPKKAK